MIAVTITNSIFWRRVKNRENLRIKITYIEYIYIYIYIHTHTHPPTHTHTYTHIQGDTREY